MLSCAFQLNRVEGSCRFDCHLWMPRDAHLCYPLLHSEQEQVFADLNVNSRIPSSHNNETGT